MVFFLYFFYWNTWKIIYFSLYLSIYMAQAMLSTRVLQNNRPTSVVHMASIPSSSNCSLICSFIMYSSTESLHFNQENDGRLHFWDPNTIFEELCTSMIGENPKPKSSLDKCGKLRGKKLESTSEWRNNKFHASLLVAYL